MSDQGATKSSTGPKHQHSPAGIHQKRVKGKDMKETAQITLNIIVHLVFS